MQIDTHTFEAVLKQTSVSNERDEFLTAFLETSPHLPLTHFNTLLYQHDQEYLVEKIQPPAHSSTIVSKRAYDPY